jgi:hypothetical protein
LVAWQSAGYGLRDLFTLALGLVLTLSVAFPAIAEDFENLRGNSNWKVYDYNASGQALRSRQPFSVSSPDGGIAFDFLYTPDTALLITGLRHTAGI